MAKEQKFKTENGTKYPKSDFAYTPSDNPSDWKLRLTETPGKVTVAQLGRAAAAFSSGGFRGNKVQLPSDAIASVKRRIRAEYAKLGVKPDEIPASVKQRSSFMIFKDGDGYRWMARYSNNYRDIDNPPEIISKASHQRFVSMVDKGEYPLPELWIWHVPEWKIGEAKTILFDDETGFAVAAGTIDKGKEGVAERLASISPEELRVSHGMPTTSIVRDESDRTVIVEHQTIEISPLPSWAAANQLTGFVLAKEQTMIPENKVQELKGLGFTDEELESLEATNKKEATNAKDIGLETKEEDVVEEVPQVDEVVEDVVLEASDVKEIEPESQPEQLLTAEVVQAAFKEAVAPLLASIDEIKARFDAIESEVKELKKSDEEKIAKEASETPAASLAAMLTSVIGKEETRVDGRTKEAKAGPPQASAVQVKTPVPLLNAFIQSQYSQQ